MAERLVDNRRTPTERKMLMIFKAGMHASPAFDDNAKHMPALTENLDIDHDGRLKLRKGYRTATLTADGFGPKLGVFHHVGTNNSNTSAIRLSADTDAIRANRRVFVLNPSDGAHKWIDVEDDIEFDWDYPAPADAPIVEFDLDALADDSDTPNVSQMAVFPAPDWYDKASIWYMVIRPTRLRILVFDNDPGGRDDKRGALVGSHGEDGISANFILHPQGIYRVVMTRDGTHVRPGAVDDQGDSLHGDEDNMFVRMDIRDGTDYVEQFRRVDLNLVRSTEFQDEFSDASQIYLTDEEGDPIDYGDINPASSGQPDGLRAGWFSFCYTYASTEYGIESAPSKSVKLALPAVPNLEGVEKESRGNTFDPALGQVADYERINMPVNITIPDTSFNALPAWANQIKIYAHRGRFAGEEIETRKLPFAFSNIVTLFRDDLDDPISSSSVEWEHENVIEPLATLPSKQFYTSPNYDDFKNITLHAGRIWAYDRGRNSIRISHIDGSGVNRYDVFPENDSVLPHSLVLEGSWQSLPHRIIQMPRNGGIYVFYRDAIRWITGKSVLSGMYSPDIGPRTDLDASGGIDGIGSISRHAIENMNNSIMFLGSDSQIYGISSSGMDSEIGKPIQRYLDEASDDDLRDAFITRFKRNMLLYLNDTIYVYDMKYGYWRTYTYDISLTDLVWSRGGISDESKLYGLGNNGTVYLLGENEADDDTEWSITSNWREVPKNTVIKHIFFQHDTPNRPELKVRFDKDGIDGNEFDFTPEQKNLFRTGVNSSHIKKRFRIKVSGTGVPPNMSMVEYE